MSYAVLSTVFVLVTVIVRVVLSRRRRLRSGPPASRSGAAAPPAPHLPALLLTAVVLIALTAAFDSLMIAAGLFTYDESQLLGPRIGLAPIEDFAYPIAALLLCTTVWGRAHDRGPELRP